jgi:hypothetical protein
MADRICGVVSASGPSGEFLACGWKLGHGGFHAWAALPTFCGAISPPSLTPLRVCILPLGHQDKHRFDSIPASPSSPPGAL